MIDPGERHVTFRKQQLIANLDLDLERPLPLPKVDGTIKDEEIEAWMYMLQLNHANNICVDIIVL